MRSRRQYGYGWGGYEGSWAMLLRAMLLRIRNGVDGGIEQCSSGRVVVQPVQTLVDAREQGFFSIFSQGLLRTRAVFQPIPTSSGDL